jgi:hypothetical protein
LCIKGQKVHLFRPSLGFLVEAQPRLKNRRGEKALFDRGAHNVFRVGLGKDFEKHELTVNFIFRIVSHSIPDFEKNSNNAILFIYFHGY